MPPLSLVEVSLLWQNVEVLKYYWNFNATLQFLYRNASTFLAWSYAVNKNVPPQFPYRNASSFFSGGMSLLKYASTETFWRY